MTVKTRLYSKLREGVAAVLPIALIVMVLCFFVTPVPTDLMLAFVIGTVMLILGLGLFTYGAEASMTPMGNYIGAKLTKSRKLLLILSVSFLLGVIITIAEPDLTVLAEQIPSIPNMVLISLVALLLDHYLVPGAKRCYICIPVFAALVFGLLPFVSAYATLGEAVKLAIAGGVVFTATTWVFTAIQERLSSGPAAKASAFFSAVSLYMAVQCFVGIFL